MKIALVHDYIKEFGGAERVLLALHEMWPEAPIYTTFCVKNSAAGKAFADAKIIESKFAWLIKHKKLYSPLRFLAPAIWRSLDFSDYDLVIASSSWYITRGFKVGPETKVICYCHTPPRYLYGYETSIEWQKYWPVKIYALIVNHFLRMFDFESAQGVNQFIANSENVAGRIKKFYRRDSVVIYPPVNVKKIIKATKNCIPGDYFLIVSRVVGAKGIEMAIEAAKKLNFKLKIIGEGPHFARVGRGYVGGKNNIEFLGRLSDEEMWQYYGKCKAFLALAKDEDFGITPVEAMAAGRPVIAYRGGGYLETVVEGKTGIFFDDYSVDGLCRAIKQYHTTEYGTRPTDCRKQAEKFDKEVFVKKIRELVDRT